MTEKFITGYAVFEKFNETEAFMLMLDGIWTLQLKLRVRYISENEVSFEGLICGKLTENVIRTLAEICNAKNIEIGTPNTTKF